MDTFNITLSTHENNGSAVGVNTGNINNYFSTHRAQQSEDKPDPFSTVPFSRDRNFVARGDILEQISERCKEPAARVALVGLGGIGKSQLAIEYAYRVREQSAQTWVFWIHASSASRFEESYFAIAKRLKLVREDAPKNALRVFKQWLSDEKNGSWLMIVDNADDLQVFFPNPQADSSNTSEPLASFLPQLHHGRILVTSRSEDLASRLTGGFENIIKIEQMDAAESMELFQQKLIRKDSSPETAELLQDLGYIPLAIAQAAAYINQLGSRGSVKRYLQLLQQNENSRESLLRKDKGDLRRDPAASNSIVATLEITFKRIEEERPTAAEMLSVLSYFHWQSIPQFAVHDYAENRKKLADADFEVEFEEDVTYLFNHRLVSAQTDPELWDMHPLVHYVTRVWSSTKGQSQHCEYIFNQTMSRVMPDPHPENWNTCKLVFPHVQASVDREPVTEDIAYYWLSAGYHAVGYIYQLRREWSAEKMMRKLVDFIEKRGWHRENLPRCLDVLGDTLVDRADFKEVESVVRRALEDPTVELRQNEKVKFALQRKLAWAMNGLGRCEEAEEQLRHVMEHRERMPGQKNSQTIEGLEDLALLRKIQGDFIEAEKAYRSLVDVKMRQYGADDNSTLASLEDVGIALQSQKRFQESERIHRQVLEKREKILPKEERIHLVAGFTNLGSALIRQEKFAEAEQMFRKAARDYEVLLAEEHILTYHAIIHIGLCLLFKGDGEQAMVFLLRAYEAAVRLLGEDDGTTRSWKKLCELASARISEENAEAASKELSSSTQDPIDITEQSASSFDSKATSSEPDGGSTSEILHN